MREAASYMCRASVVHSAFLWCAGRELHGWLAGGICVVGVSQVLCRGAGWGVLCVIRECHECVFGGVPAQDIRRRTTYPATQARDEVRIAVPFGRDGTRRTGGNLQRTGSCAARMRGAATKQSHAAHTAVPLGLGRRGESPGAWANRCAHGIIELTVSCRGAEPPGHCILLHPGSPESAVVHDEPGMVKFVAREVGLGHV